MESKKIIKEMSVNEIIKMYPKSIGIFNKFNIDSCCGGAELLERAAKKANVDVESIIDEINRAIEV